MVKHVKKRRINIQADPQLGNYYQDHARLIKKLLGNHTNNSAQVIYILFSFRPIDTAIIGRVIQVKKTRYPEFELKLDRLLSNVQSHSVFTVLHKIVVEGSAIQKTAAGETLNADADAKIGYGAKVLKHLKSIGEWSLKVAQDIGTKVAAEVIKKFLGI